MSYSVPSFLNVTVPRYLVFTKAVYNRTSKRHKKNSNILNIHAVYSVNIVQDACMHVCIIHVFTVSLVGVKETGSIC
jgi:hypothetical protein